MSALVQLKDVEVGYGRQAVLKDINLELAHNSFIGLLGPNGSGKTTLLKTIAGILPPISGRVLFNNGNDDRVAIGYVPQRESLDASFLLSTFEVVLMGSCGRVRPGRFISREEQHWARECIGQCGVEALERHRFLELSGGQRQRVLIARALVARPDLLLLDEPTAGVDPAATEAIVELLDRFYRGGMTILMSNHELHVVKRLAKRVVWLQNGRIEQGETNEMLGSAKLERLSVQFQ